MRRFTVVGHPARDKPRWDGAEQLALGVTDADGRGVLSVPPAHRDAVADLVAGLAADTAADVLAARLPALLGRPEQVCFTGVFRSSQTPGPAAGRRGVGAVGRAGHPRLAAPLPG